MFSPIFFIEFDIIVFISSQCSAIQDIPQTLQNQTIHYLVPHEPALSLKNVLCTPKGFCFHKTNINFLLTSTTRSSKLSLPITISEQLNYLIFNIPASLCPHSFILLDMITQMSVYRLSIHLHSFLVISLYFRMTTTL